MPKTTPPRDPRDVASDLRELSDNAARAFVPRNLSDAIDLVVEFAESTCAALEAAGVLKPAPAVDAAPAADPAAV